MKYASLGGTDLLVSRLCLGTMTFGKQTDEVEAHRIMDRAAEGGINFIDTADGYPMGCPDLSQVGQTEEIIGRWLKGKRGRFIIATKAGAQMSDNPADQGGSRRHLTNAIEGSLRRLGIDYVDLYQMHFDDVATPMEETLRTLDEILSSGKARHIGISNIEPNRLKDALEISNQLGLNRYISVQPRYNMLYREPEKALLPLAMHEKLGVIPYNPIAGGMLSGRYSQGSIPESGRFSNVIGSFGAMYRQRYWNEHAFEIVEAIGALAKEYGIALPALAIAWVLSNPAITSAIVGASRADQLNMTMMSVDFDLDAELKTKIDQVVSRG